MDYKRKKEAKEWARENVIGDWSTVITPFSSSGDLDEDALRYDIQHISKLGVRGIGCCWSMGEFWALSIEERKRIAQVLVDEAGVALKAVHTSHHSLRDCIELTRHAESIGADIAVLSPPYIAAKDFGVIYRFFEKVSESTEIGIALYNTPMANVILSPEEIAKLIEIPNICVLKEATNPSQTLRELEMFGDKIVVSHPQEEAMFTAYFYGLKMQALFAATQDWNFDIPGKLGNFVTFIDLMTSGKYDRAISLYREKIYPLKKVFWKWWEMIQKRNGGVLPVQLMKSWAEIVGMKAGNVRDPLLPLLREDREALRRDLEAAGLFGS